MVAGGIAPLDGTKRTLVAVVGNCVRTSPGTRSDGEPVDGESDVRLYAVTVPVISGYLLWTRRVELSRLTPRPSLGAGQL